jgi:hypothetical protein
MEIEYQGLGGGGDSSSTRLYLEAVRSRERCLLGRSWIRTCMPFDVLQMAASSSQSLSANAAKPSTSAIPAEKKRKLEARLLGTSDSSSTLGFAEVTHHQSHAIANLSALWGVRLRASLPCQSVSLL